MRGERVGLDRLLGAVEGGVGADRDRGRPAARLLACLVQDGEPACVDAVGRDRGVRRRLHVRGREAELAAALVAADHDPLDPVRAAQRLRGPGYVARCQQRPDVGGGDRDAVQREQRQALGRVVVLLAQLGDERDVTGRPQCGRGCS